MYTGTLTLISAISGSTYYVDECNGQERSINMYVHIIGEPGSGKSTPVNYIKSAMCQLTELFPDQYNKKINNNDLILTTPLDSINESNTSTLHGQNLRTASANGNDSNVSDKKKGADERMKMMVNFDTELALFRQMALIGDLFAITDELDSQLVRLGVFKSNDESAAPGSKLLTQAYDGIHNESRGTGTAKHIIKNAKLTIFGASTGQRYAFNMRNFSQNIGNDGVVVRMSYLVMPYCGPKPICNRLPISMPNVLHIATVVTLLVNCGFPIQLRFEKLQSDLDNEPTDMLPLYQRERRSFVDGDSLPMSYELVSTSDTRKKRRTIDVEDDGSTLSAYGLLEKLIKEDLAKSEDLNRVPHVRALYAKSSQKLPRLVANTHLLFVAMHLLTSNTYELFNHVSFREGSGTANSINGLSTKFLETAKKVVHDYMKAHLKIETIKVGDNKVIQAKFILDVTKEAVLAGYNLFKHMQDVQLAIFDLSCLDNIVKTRIQNSSRKSEEARKEFVLSMVQPQDSDMALIFKLPSPILKRVWITNKKDAPSWAGIFCQSSKKSANSKTTERGIKAIDALLNSGLMKQCNYLPKNSGLWKVSPTEIEHSEDLQIALREYIGIDIATYKQLYEEWMYPSDLTTMTQPLIDHLIGSPDIFAKYYHNYVPEKYAEFRSRIAKLEHDGVIRKYELDGKSRWEFLNYHNSNNDEQTDMLNTYIVNQIETCRLEEVSSNEHGLKRKLTTLVKRNEVIISPSSSFTLTPAKRTHVENQSLLNLDEGVHSQNVLLSNNNNADAVCETNRADKQNSSSNTTMNTAASMVNRDLPVINTIDCGSFMSTTSAIPNSNIASSISILPTRHINSRIPESPHNHMAASDLKNDNLIVYSPMHVDSMESSLMPLSSTHDKSLMNLIDMISSSDGPPDFMKLTEDQPATIPSIASFLDSLSACAKSASPIHDMEEQANFHSANINIDSFTLSPVLSTSMLTSNLSKNNSSLVFNNYLNMKNNMSAPGVLSEEIVTETPSTISTHLSKTIQASSNELNPVNSMIHDHLNSSKSTIMPTISNEPAVQLSSQQIDITSCDTESSITITTHSSDMISEIAPDDIPPGGPKDKKNWNPSSDGTSKWSEKRIASYLDEKTSDIYKIILTGNWGVCNTKSVISKRLSKQYTGLGQLALCRLDTEGLVTLQPIYAYMDGTHYKTADGYLKIVPDNGSTSRRVFVNKLASYEVTLASYLESFVDQSKVKFDTSCNKPAIYTLTRENDIAASTYFFSPYFKETIESFALYKERLQVDPSSVLYNPYNSRPTHMISKVKDAFLRKQEHIRHQASKKANTQLGEPLIMKSKLRSGSHNKKKNNNK